MAYLYMHMVLHKRLKRQKPLPFCSISKTSHGRTSIKSRKTEKASSCPAKLLAWLNKLLFSICNIPLLSMACLSHLQLFLLPRYHLNWSNYASSSLVQLRELRAGCKWGSLAIAKKTSASQSSVIENSNNNEFVEEKKTTRSAKRGKVATENKKKSENGNLLVASDGSTKESSSALSDDSKKKSPRTRKKDASDAAGVEKEKKEKKVRSRKISSDESPEKYSNLLVTSDGATEESSPASSDDSKKKSRRTQKKDASNAAGVEKEKKEKVSTRKMSEGENIIMEDKESEAEISDQDEPSFTDNVEEETDDDLELIKDDGEDISFTYGWPPLVCCFGSAQHAFVPSGRPANRLLNYEIHESMKDALWSPENYVRAPGGSAGAVAIALATLGGKVAFMGKLADDYYGQVMLYYMNVNNVQTRSVRMDRKRATAVSLMKIGKRSRLKMSCVKPCAEDCLTKAEINIDVLKEAKMFYFSTHSLLERSMRSTAIRAIRISKKLGGVIFYDLNLPMPLWHSREETMNFIQQAWNLADIIEVTKQELEFLCGITPSEEFDTKDNDRSKFVHYEPEVIAPLWHENLKVLFVTNGTSKIHYYTKEFDGSVLGMEDAPLTPFSSDMSASGDGIVAAIIRMFSVELDLITDKGYIEKTIKYAINCGVTEQWYLGRQRGWPPTEYMMDKVTPDENGIKSITETEYRTLPPPTRDMTAKITPYEDEDEEETEDEDEEETEYPTLARFR